MAAAATGASGFLNRNREREHLDTLLADVRAGQSAALVLQGEAGVGKTALLRYALQQASDFRIAQIAEGHDDIRSAETIGCRAGFVFVQPMDDNRAPERSEVFGDAKADSRTRAGDERHLILERGH